MKSIRNIFLITLLLFGLTNCGTTVYRLSPDEESSMEMGRRVIEKENLIAFSSLSYEDRTENEFVFYLYAENKDAEAVLENMVIFSGNLIGEEIDYENDIDILKSQKNYWQNEVLRRTELYQNENVGGIFYLPIIEEAKFIKIYVPLGKTTHTYKFEQIAT